MCHWLNRAHIVVLFVLVLGLVSCGQQMDEEVTKLRETITAQETEIAQLTTAQLSSQRLESTAEPTGDQEQRLEDLVRVELVNEGLSESYGRESYVLIYSIENGSDFPMCWTRWNPSWTGRTGTRVP